MGLWICACGSFGCFNHNVWLEQKRNIMYGWRKKEKERDKKRKPKRERRKIK
jgi:hypothetical protein